MTTRSVAPSAGLIVLVLLFGGGAVCLRGDASPPEASVQFPTEQEMLKTVWAQFLNAMRSGSDAAVRSQCTVAGYRSLLSGIDPHQKRADQWRRRAREWSQWGAIRWQNITSLTAYGRLGPKENENSVALVLTPRGWKMDQWAPAEAPAADPGKKQEVTPALKEPRG